VNLSHRETDLIFAIMRELSGDFANAEIRARVGRLLLELLHADFFISYIWNHEAQCFEEGVPINTSDDHLNHYETYFQFNDPITPVLQRRRAATPVSAVMAHEKLRKTEFFNDFLKPEGLHFGLNYFAFDCGQNIGDLRIWRMGGKDDFTRRDANLVDAIGPSFVNALTRSNRLASAAPARRFVQSADEWNLTRREAEVADMLAAGLADEEICGALGVSKPTLRSHVGAVFRKVGVRRRSQLAPLLQMKNHHLR